MCAKQVINVGSAPNSNDGDALRIAFQKCVSNFDELYTDDTNDVNSIVATSPIARDNATGVVTISLNDLGISTAKIADDAVTVDKLANAINSAITANTAKVTNATHTGDVTGSGALTIANDAVTIDKIADAVIVTASEGIGSNDNDTTIPTSAATKAYVDNSASGGISVSVITGNTNAASGNLYVLTANLTLTLPSSPSAGNYIKISNRSGVATCVVARNSEKIMGATADLTLDKLNSGFEMVYSGTAQGWILIGVEGTAA